MNEFDNIKYIIQLRKEEKNEQAYRLFCKLWNKIYGFIITQMNKYYIPIDKRKDLLNDLKNDIYINIINLDISKEQDQLKNYIFTSIINKIIDFKRKKEIETISLFELEYEYEEQKQQDIYIHIKKLKDIYIKGRKKEVQQTINLFIDDLKTTKEIEQITKQNRQTIKAQIWDFKQYIKKIWKY